jgi:hypothetical protein
MIYAGVNLFGVSLLSLRHASFRQCKGDATHSIDHYLSSSDQANDAPWRCRAIATMR